MKTDDKNITIKIISKIKAIEERMRGKVVYLKTMPSESFQVVGIIIFNFKGQVALATFTPFSENKLKTGAIFRPFSP